MPSSCGSILSLTICLFLCFFLHSFWTARGEFSSLGSSGGSEAAGQRGTSSLRSFRDEEEQLAGPFQCLGGFKKNPLFKSLGSWKFFKVDPPQSRVIHCLKPSNFKRNSTLELNQVLYLQVSNQVCAIFTVSRWARARPGPDVSRASASHKRIQGFSGRKLSTVLQIDLFCTWVRKFEFESRQLTHKGGGRA